jgi:DnaJ like chaperone protein
MAKVLGAMLGVILGLGLRSAWAAAVFAGIGIVLGHRWDILHRPIPDLDPLPEPPTRAEIETAARLEFAAHLVTLFVWRVRAEGQAVPEETASVRRYFARELLFSSSELAHVETLWRQRRTGESDVREAARRCRDELTPAERVALFSGLVTWALADRPLSPREREALDDLAERLGISEGERRRVLNGTMEGAEACYALLEIRPDSSDAELRTAFRRLATLYHPDKVAHLGPKAQETASARFRALREAYERLRAVRRL